MIYVDVDDTLIRTAGCKRIPVSEVGDHVLRQFEAGAELYCRSSGGADYAREVATELGLDHCFTTFLPKPQVAEGSQSPDTILAFGFLQAAIDQTGEPVDSSERGTGRLTGEVAVLGFMPTLHSCQRLANRSTVRIDCIC